LTRDDVWMTREHPESRFVSVWIDVRPADAYGYICDPVNLPQWAAGLADGEVKQVGGVWLVASPMGDITVEFAAPNELGVADHWVRTSDGQAFYNPMRVLPDADREDRCEVVFAVRRRAGMSDEQFDADAAAVSADLERLSRILTG
jgi:hypothetical protein